MRGADAVTVLRIVLVFVTGYLIIIKLNAILIVLLMFLLFVLDTVDGYLTKNRKHSVIDFFSYVIREAKSRRIGQTKSAKGTPKYGAYFDIAGDRITEYTFWIIFTYLRLLPLFVVLIIVVRNSLADTFTISKSKTFSNMKTRFGRIASSHLSRGAYGAIKAINFAYLSLVFVSNWPIGIGYILTTIAVVYSLFRGAAEIYEAVV